MQCLHFVKDVQLEEKLENPGLSQGILVLFLCDYKVVLTSRMLLRVSYILVQNKKES